MKREQSKDQHEQEWEVWQAVRANDRDAFEKLVEPHLPELFRLAKHEIDYFRFLGRLQATDLTEEELVGETLIRAWDDRFRRPQRVTLRGWLLGTLYRMMKKIAGKERRYRYQKAISLDAEIPPDPDTLDTDEQFWEWHQIDDQNRWEDVIPGEVPVTFDIADINREEIMEALEPRERHVLLLHDHFELTVDEVASIMNQTLKEILGTLQQARVSLEQRLRDQQQEP